MAEEALKKLEEQLNCSICLGTYTDPRQLQCNHVYCQKCLVKVVVRDQEGQLTLACPVCRQNTPVPAIGVTGLQSAFHINHLLDIQDSVKKIGDLSTVQKGVVGATNFNPEKKVSYCSVHEEKELEIYCETCRELICTHCAIKGGKHHSHEYELLKMTSVCQNDGQVSTSDLPDPSQCHVTGVSVEVAVVGEKLAVDLEVINFRSQPCKEPIKSLECELVSEITGTRARGTIERRGRNQYELSYQPTIKGRHQLHIKAEGQHISGSPFRVAAKLPVEKLGTPILTLGGVKSPYGVAINQKGEVVVAERDGCCISVFSPSGKKRRSFHIRYSLPRAVAVDGEGNILMVDGSDSTVRKYTPEGNFLTAALDSAGNKLEWILDVAYNARNNKVYAVNQNGRIEVLNSDLTFLSTFGEMGSGKGQLLGPQGISCDSTGKVYVVDSHNHRIQVFTAKGKFLRMFGSPGVGCGELFIPVGVAVDTSGRVYVSEFGGDRVSVFSSNGQFVTSFGGKGKGAGEFDSPHGLAIDDTGVLYVCDSDNNSVQVF